MHALHLRTQDAPHRQADVSGPFPWEQAHAAPEDRAVGLELELIELVHRRQVLGNEDPAGARALDGEIDQLLAALGEVTVALPIAG